MPADDLDTWVKENYVRSYRTACLILVNPADAEEAVQEAFLRAWRFRASVGAGADIRPWLYRVVVNTCNSKLRQEIPHRDRRSSDEDLGDISLVEDAPNQIALGHDVQRALRDLPSSLRIVIVLRYYAELSEREIATAIGRRPGTVKSRLHEARRLLGVHPTAAGTVRQCKRRVGGARMTMIDEDVLSRALNETAASFEASEGATERILAAATPPLPPVRTASRHKVIPSSGRARVALVAAAVVLLVAGITLSNESSRSNNPSSAIQAAGLPASVHGGSFGSSAGATGSAAGSSPTSRNPAKASGQTPGSSAPQSGIVGESAKIEANGSVYLTIGNGSLESVLDKLTNLAGADGGFVSNTQAQFATGVPGGTSATIVLQVPEPSFGSLVTQVQTYGHVTSVNTTSTDVTGQYVDLQARIAAMQASRQQYLTIMTKATTIGAILAVQEQLDTIQSQIEQLQGQLQVLNNETTYGSLSVTLTEPGHKPPPTPVRVSHPGSGLGRAWHDSWTGFVSGFEFLVKIAGPTIFILLLLGMLAVLGRWGWRASRRRMI